MTSESSSRCTTPSPSGVDAQEVLDLEGGLAEEAIGALGLERRDGAHDDPERGRRGATIAFQGSLALVAGQVQECRAQVGEVQQRQVVVVAVREHEREHAGLRGVEVEDAGKEQGSERGDGRSHGGAELTGEGEQVDRMPRRLEGHADLLDTSRDLRIGAIAGQGHAGEVALDIGHEHRDART